MDSSYLEMYHGTPEFVLQFY